jgi:iron complex transport system substrate-binding protein
MFPPERIVCLTEETVETLYLLGEERRIVGVSGYAVRPARVRREKPRVSASSPPTSTKSRARTRPRLAFSDLQADVAAELIRRNVAVHAFNQRDIAGILDAIAHSARWSARRQGRCAGGGLERRLMQARERAAALARHPRVYFENGRADDLGIGWVASSSRLPAASTSSRAVTAQNAGRIVS